MGKHVLLLGAQAPVGLRCDLALHNKICASGAYGLLVPDTSEHQNKWQKGKGKGQGKSNGKKGKGKGKQKKDE